MVRELIESSGSHDVGFDFEWMVYRMEGSVREYPQ